MFPAHNKEDGLSFNHSHELLNVLIVAQEEQQNGAEAYIAVPYDPR
jgi:hypothetical protein